MFPKLGKPLVRGSRRSFRRLPIRSAGMLTQLRATTNVVNVALKRRQKRSETLPWRHVGGIGQAPVKKKSFDVAGKRVPARLSPMSAISAEERAANRRGLGQFPFIDAARRSCQSLVSSPFGATRSGRHVQDDTLRTRPLGRHVQAVAESGRGVWAKRRTRGRSRAMIGWMSMGQRRIRNRCRPTGRKKPARTRRPEVSIWSPTAERLSIPFGRIPSKGQRKTRGRSRVFRVEDSVEDRRRPVKGPGRGPHSGYSDVPRTSPPTWRCGECEPGFPGRATARGRS